MLAVGYASAEKIPSTVFGQINRIPFSMITTTCNVHLGFSGGPVFSSNRRLLGLIVGKLSVGSINFVLPVTEFMETVKNYISKNGLLLFPPKV